MPLFGRMSKPPRDDAAPLRRPAVRVAVWQRLALAAALFAAPVADAGQWVYLPSYYSHAVAPPDRPLPSSRGSYRVPSVSNNPGFAVRGYQRINYFQLRNGRGSVDRTIYYRGNVELDP